MGQALEQIISEVRDGDIVNVTMVSNQDNGIAGYAAGGLVFHKATGGVVLGGPKRQSARLEGEGLQMFFSDRKLSIDPPPPAGGFGQGPRQPFDANATEKLGLSLSLGASAHTMRITLFGGHALVSLSPMGDLLVGLGPSLGNSAPGVFVVAFEGIVRPPR